MRHHWCLDSDNTLVVNDYVEGEENQQWVTGEDTVHHRTDRNRVLDIAGKSDDCGARMCSWEFHGGDHQRWEFDCQ